MLSNCSLQSCAESIARIQRNHQQSPTYAERKYPVSYREHYTDSEEQPGRRFCVLVAPPDLSGQVVRTELPSEDLTFAGWKSTSTRSALSFEGRRKRKEEADRNWKGEPSTETPSPDPQGWFLSAEAQGIVARQEYEEFLRLDPEKIRRRRPPREAELQWHPFGNRPAVVSTAAGAKKTLTRLVADPEDVRPREIIRPKKRFDAAPFARSVLRARFREKLNPQQRKEIAEVLAWQAKGLSCREIAEQTRQTQGWVRWRLSVVSKLFFRNGMSDLAGRPQPKNGLAAL